MILAAGLGTRMEPLSRRCAKPALPVLDEPVVLHMVRDLAAQGVERVVVNAHALPATLERALRDSPIPVDLFVETTLSGSAGGIRLARERLDGDEPFLVLNADMRLTIDLAALLAAHRTGAAPATLALRDDERKRAFGTIGYDAKGDVRRITRLWDAGGEEADALFIGVQVMEPRVFDWMPERVPLELMPDVYVPALERGERIHTWLHPHDDEWWPVGDPSELLRVNLWALREATRDEEVLADPSASVRGEITGPAWIGAGADVATGARIGPWVVVGAGARVGAGAQTRGSVLLPGSHLEAGTELIDGIAFGGEVWRRA